jgi:hypothetical protein
MGYRRDGRLVDAGGCFYRRGSARIFGETLSCYLRSNFTQVLKRVAIGATIGAVFLLINWAGCIG